MLYILLLLIHLYLELIKMHTRRDFIRKVIANLNHVVVSKRYDYIANHKGNEYLVFRRLYEGKPWELIIRIPDDTLDSKIYDWKYTQANKIQRYKNDPKHGNRYIQIDQE